MTSWSKNWGILISILIWFCFFHVSSLVEVYILDPRKSKLWWREIWILLFACSRFGIKFLIMASLVQDICQSKILPWFISPYELLMHLIIVTVSMFDLTCWNVHPQIICAKVREGDQRIVRLKEGEPKGRHVVIVDDLVQSGGTLIECQVRNRRSSRYSESTSLVRFLCQSFHEKEFWRLLGGEKLYRI